MLLFVHTIARNRKCTNNNRFTNIISDLICSFFLKAEGLLRTTFHKYSIYGHFSKYFQFLDYNLLNQCLDKTYFDVINIKFTDY